MFFVLLLLVLVSFLFPVPVPVPVPIPVPVPVPEQTWFRFQTNAVSRSRPKLVPFLVLVPVLVPVKNLAPSHSVCNSEVSKNRVLQFFALTVTFGSDGMHILDSWDVEQCSEYCIRYCLLLTKLSDKVFRNYVFTINLGYKFWSMARYQRVLISTTKLCGPFHEKIKVCSSSQISSQTNFKIWIICQFMLALLDLKSFKLTFSK